MIGLLNDKMNSIKYSINFENSDLSPINNDNKVLESVDNFVLKWDKIRNRPVELKVKFDRPAFVERILINIGDKTGLTSVKIKDANSKIISRFDAQTNAIITTKSIELECSSICETLSIVFNTNYSDIEIGSIQYFGSIDNQHEIFPIPQFAAYGEYIPHTTFTTFGYESELCSCAGKVLSEKYFEITSISLTKSNNSPSISFVVDANLPANAYKLNITKDSATITASDKRGFVIGAETFIKLTDKNGVRRAKIEDAPAHPMRGIHMYLPAEHQMEFARRFIKYLISPMGYNVVIMEVAAGMIYESHPKINDVVKNAIEKAKQGIWPVFPHSAVAEGIAVSKNVLLEYIEYIRSFGIEVVPEVQSLGHVPFMTMTYPEIAEIDENDTVERVDVRVQDAIPSKFYPHCYCPSNEKSYEILFDLLDEIIDLFKPTEYVHMGHDEVYYMGVCPRCKGKDHSQLFADDINKIYDHLKQKGLKMMIWSDMLQPVTKYQTFNAVDMIPKDILCLDFIWYFHLDKDIEDNLLNKGFKVAIGNFYASHYPRFESRIAKEGMVGGQISMWARTNEEKLQFGGKLYDIQMVAEMLWDGKYTHYCNWCYDKYISQNMKSLREHFKGIKYPSGNDKCTIHTHFENPDNIFESSNDNKIVKIDQKCDSVLISHTIAEAFSTLPMVPSETIANYIIKYDDESTETIEVKNGVNIGHHSRRHNAPIKHKLFRHYGYTATYETDGSEEIDEFGNLITYYELEYLPKSDKKICSIELVVDKAFDSKIYLKSLKTIKV